MSKTMNPTDAKPRKPRLQTQDGTNWRTIMGPKRRLTLRALMAAADVLAVDGRRYRVIDMFGGTWYDSNPV